MRFTFFIRVGFVFFLIFGSGFSAISFAQAEQEEQKQEEHSVSQNIEESQENQESQIAIEEEQTLSQPRLYSEETKELVSQLLNFLPYNVFHELPKANKVFDVHYGPFSEFTYGPYQVKKEIYQKPWISKMEVNKRIYVLEELLEKSKKSMPEEHGENENKKIKMNPEDMEKQIHLADLWAIKARLTKKRSNINKAVELYAAIFKYVTSDFYPYVALNLVNSLLLKGDTITALPILKKTFKEHGSDKEFRKKLNTSMIELYFLAGRYKKAWEELESKILNKKVEEETFDYKLRVGDIMCFLKKYQDASDWYQSILKPENTKTFSENLSWLYLAESVYQTGHEDIAQKIFKAMQPYFKDTVYGDAIAYRIEPTVEKASEILTKTRNRKIKDWLQVQLLREKFDASPQVITSESFDDLLIDRDYSDTLKKQVLIMQAYSYEYEKRFYQAIRVYEKVSREVKDPQVTELIDRTIIRALMAKGESTETEKEATEFLRFMKDHEFRLRTYEPERIYAMLYHNLELMGLKGLAAEMTLHIIDKSIHRPKDKAKIYLKMAKALFDARADYAALRALELVDKNLIDYDDKQNYNKLQLLGLKRTKRYQEAVVFLENWENEGTSAKNIYWIALQKIEILLEKNKDEAALRIVEDLIGNSDTDLLPPAYSEFIHPLLAYQVILNNKLNKNFEALAVFYANENKILKSPLKQNAILAAMSAALAMNKKSDVDKLLNVAKRNFNPETYQWMEQWTSGQLWINEIDNYLEQRTAIQQNQGG